MVDHSFQRDLIFQALSDFNRRLMVRQLSRAPASVVELGAPLPMTLQAATKHLRLLERSGLVRSERIGRTRTCYIDPQALCLAQEWIAAYFFTNFFTFVPLTSPT